MGGRVVEGTGLENRQARKRLEGSNPSPSARPFCIVKRCRLFCSSLYVLAYASETARNAALAAFRPIPVGGGLANRTPGRLPW